MNLEQLYKTISNNFNQIPNKKSAILLYYYFYDLIEWKKQKLKLGAITFEIKETTFHGITLLEEVDIRYIRQDNTKTDELKLETRLKAISWKWDSKNILAFLVVIFIFFLQLYNFIYNLYCKYLPTIAYRAEHFDYILKFGFETSLTPNTLGDLRKWSSANYWLVNLLTDFCTYFNIIF